MRIISGELGGRTIRSHERSGLRPTTDRVREAIFNMLGSRIDFDAIEVLELFAGTGALGIEAISRGASRCTFVESDRRTATVITENVMSLGVADRSRVVVRDAMTFIASTDETFDLVIADPPYALTIFDQLVHDVIARDLVRSDGLFLLEHASTLVPRTPVGAEIIVQRTFGDTAVTLFAPRPRTLG